MDEPLAGLDPLAVVKVREILLTLKKRSIGILITDHRVLETLQLVDRAYVLHEGKVLQSGTAEEVRNSTDVQRHYLGEPSRATF
ncbi:MAG: hypothetical protein WC314_24075 [Vulcanimicrobiota bacterium]